MLLSVSRRWPLYGFPLALLCAAPVPAQTTATLTGVVVNSVTRQPIARVLVESPTEGAGVLTGNAGRFSFTGVPLGPVLLRYKRPGYYDPQSPSFEANASVTVTSSTPEQTLELVPAANLRGQISLSDGDSPVGLRVTLLREYVVNGWRRWQRDRSATARGDGSFSFEDLQPGNYLLHAEASLDPAPSDAPARVRSGYAPVYAPDTGDIASAGIIALGPGQTGEARLRLQRVPFYPVKVRVAGEAQGQFAIDGNGFTDWSARYSREDGTIAAELPAGSYVLTGHSYGRDRVEGELPLHVMGAPLSGQTLTMSAPAVLHIESARSGGEAEAAQGQSILLTLVPVNPAGSPLTVVLPITPQTARDAQQGEVPPGKYWVSAQEGGSAGYLAELSSGGVDLFAQPLEVLPGASPALSATVRQDFGQIDVARTGDALVRSCFLHAIPLSPGGVARSLRWEGAGASMNLPGVAPGDYIVLATASRSEIPFREPGVLGQLRGARVTVIAGGSAQATVSSLFTEPL